MKKRILSLVLCIAMCMGMASTLAGCGGGSTPDAFVIMTEQLDGLFNPFFSTSAPDGTVVAMTQIGMLGSKYVNGEVQVAYGEDEAVAVKDYDIVENDDGGDILTYEYFCLSDELIKKDHSWPYANYPAANGTRYTNGVDHGN